MTFFNGNIFNSSLQNPIQIQTDKATHLLGPSNEAPVD